MILSDIDPSEILTRKEASAYLLNRWRQRVSTTTLAQYACVGPSGRKNGPKHYHLDGGQDVFYLKSDLDNWARKRLLGVSISGVLAAAAR